MKGDSMMKRVLKLVTCVTMVSQLMILSVAQPLKPTLRDNAGRSSVHQTSMATNESNSRVTGQLQLMMLANPTNTRRVRLCNKNGYFLQISTRGKLRGTRSMSDPHTIIKMESVGPSIVRLRSANSNVYFCMNNRGVSYVTAQATDECLFKEKLGENHFHTFASHKYSGRNFGNYTNDFYIAIKKNGKFKHGANTSGEQKSVDFMVIPVDT